MIEIFDKNIIKIIINTENYNPPKNTYGIDIGYTLTKFVYIKKDNLILFTKPTSIIKKTIETELQELIKKGFLLNLTGGGAFSIYKLLNQENKCKLIKEFEANAYGAKRMLTMQSGKLFTRAIIVCLGTGTSIVLLDKEARHLGGTALGGGYFIGLVQKLFEINDYDKALKLAKIGNRYNVDLQVSDIYDKQDPRIDSLFREFNAASLGRLNPQANIQDYINSILCMLGENIGTISCLFAETEHVNEIIFCGGFLKNNRVLIKVLKMICRYHNKKAIFLKNPEYVGSIGTLEII